MKNYQRLVFLIISTLIVVSVMIASKSAKKESVSIDSPGSTSYTQMAETIPATEPEESTVEEKRDVEDVSKNEQEIVTEGTIEQNTLASEKEIIMLAKLLYAEAGGISSTTEQSCVIWTVLNRVDSSSFPNTIAKCITQPNQYAYRSSTKVTDHCLWLARDVVSRWEREHNGETDVGRTLPKEYMFFHGKNGHNHFKTSCKSRNYWDYSLVSPYES